jgi:hypothetical protein
MLRSGRLLNPIPDPIPTAETLGIVIRASEIGGRGAFATRRVAIHAVVGRYTGEELTRAQFEARYPHGGARYVLEIGGGVFIDAREETAGWCRFINSNAGLHRPSNVRAEPGGVIRATANIAAGSELLMAYGRTYDGWG